MRRLWALPLVILLVATTTSLALAKGKTGAKPGVVITESVVVTASVAAIDYEKRTVTLKDPAGNVVTTKVDDTVKNFNQVKQGDEIVAKYFDSIAVYVEKKQGKPSAGGMEMVEVAAPGEMPGGFVVNTAEITASVEAINYKKRTVTLKGPEGKTVTLKVDKKVKKFKNINKGDEVVVRHTEAVAISVASR